MIYCLNPTCPNPQNPAGNVHCQYCGVPIALRNRFKALSVLGKGGFGITYLAQDLDNRNKPCVIKRLTYQGADTYATDKARQLFEQEAERLDQLIHPQIPRLLAYFQEGGYLYLVQEVIEGQTLHTELQSQGTFNEAKIRTVLQGLLPVLHFVHGRSVIHRDIKPDNIMRRRNGELVLIDFGVAKFLEESGFSQSTTIGTPGYAAPEQIQGRVKPSSDLFALGATCFQLLSNCFDNDKVSTVGYGWVQKWQTYVAAPISQDLVDILTRMMAVEERFRYATAAEVLGDLNRNQTPAPPTTFPPQKAAASNLPTVVVSPVQPISPQPVTGKSSPGTRSPVSSGSGSAPLGILGNTATSTTSAGTPSARTALSRSGNVVGPSGQSQLIKKVPIEPVFWLRYGLLSYAGHSLGFLIAALVTACYVVATHSDPGNLSSAELDDVLALMCWMHWPVSGFFVGFAQWMAIKQWLPRAMWWLPATVAGFWAIALAVATGYADAFSGIVVGTFVGLPQWGAMRQQAPRAGWWVLWAMVFTAVLCEAITSNFLLALGWLLVVPLLDGLFLAWILRQQIDESQVTP